MAPKKDTSGEQFSFDVVACLLAALAESQVTIGAQHYKVMAKIDDSRTPSAYEHLFRPVKARAKEISEMIKKGELGDLKASPVKKTKENGVATGEKKGTKRGRKAKAETEDGSEDDGATNKKVKVEQTENGEVEGADGQEEMFV